MVGVDRHDGRLARRSLPNPGLAQLVLRIQHIAQERRVAGRYPGHDRFVVVEDGERVGRLYVHQGASTLHVLDLTLLHHRSRPRSRTCCG